MFALKQNPENAKNHTSAFVGEVLGTTIFLFIAEGAAKTAKLSRTTAQTQEINSPLDSQTIMMIATSFGLALLVSAWMFYRITGGLFNPAITVALWLAGALTHTRAITLFIAQSVGGILAAALVFALTPVGAAGLDAVNTSLSPGVSIAQGVMLEFLGTSILVFAVLMLAVEKHRATYLAPVGIGLTLFGLHLFLVSWTGCSLNPARSLGPAAVAGDFPPEHWIYWVAPITGAIFSVMYHQVLKAFQYSNAVMDQDAAEEQAELVPLHMKIYNSVKGDKAYEHSSSDRDSSMMERKNGTNSRTDNGGLPLPVTQDELK